MALEPIPGFRSLETHHCVTGSIRHVYEFHDYPISEDLLLGLGSGVGFIYWHMKGMSPFFGGRANFERPGEEGLEKTIGRRTGVKVQSFRTSSARKAEKSLIKMLESGEPVVLQVDMGFLPYFDLPDDYHFGGHVIAAAGIDLDARQVLVVDRDKESHFVSMEDLERARGSKFKPFPPNHTWYTFDFYEARPPKPEEVRQAIREVSTGMLEPPISNIGVKGIRKAAKRVLKWPEMMDADEVRWTCFNIFIFIDATGGTGGGIFRYMYGRFLKEAAGIINDERLVEVGDAMREIGDRWQAVAEIFERASAEDVDSQDFFPETTAPLLEIADLEQKAWERLYEIAE